MIERENIRERSPARGRLLAAAVLLPLTATAAEPAATTTPPAATHLQLETSTIKGHHELPRVLYIVPWKRAETGDLPGRPPGSLLDEGLMPIERAEFRRELRYSSQLAINAGPAAADNPSQRASQRTSSGE